MMPFAGALQVTGAIVMLASLIPKRTLVRKDIAHVSAGRIGSGYGVVAVGFF